MLHNTSLLRAMSYPISPLSPPTPSSTSAKCKKICIVGGVAGGASAAARIRRLDENAQITMFEKGNYVSFANCGLPYYVGNVIQKESNLIVTAPSTFKGMFNIDVKTKHEITSIDKEKKTITVNDLANNKTYVENYDYLVLAPGSKPIVPKLPGANAPGVFILRDIPDSNQIKVWIENRQATSATIIGGGFIGLEMAENLRHLGLKVNIVELAPHVMPMLSTDLATHIQRTLTKNGVQLYTGIGLKEIRTKEDDTLQCLCSDNSTIESDLVLLSVGVLPESHLAQEAGLQMGLKNSIAVNEHMQTSDPFIYAAGDAVQTYDFITKLPTVVPLAGPANREARVIADNICGIPSTFRGVQSTSICGLFGMTAASTGHTIESLKRINYKDIEDVCCIRSHPPQHVTYYPGQKTLHLNVYFNKKSGQILGAQCVGEEGVDKRIDILASYIQKEAKIQDLAEAELCYAPQFGAAKDPINMIGFIGENVMNGLARITPWEQTKQELETGATAGKFYLDVRAKTIFDANPLDGFVNIPLMTLREHIEEIPKDKEIRISCNVGKTAYYASRILEQKGYKTSIVSGGYFSYDVLFNKKQ